MIKLLLSLVLFILFSSNATAVNYEYGYTECYKDLGAPKSWFYDSDNKINPQAVAAYKDNQEKNYCQSVMGTSNSNWDSPDCNDKRYVISDAIGIEKVCKTKFPTWGERFLFTRTGTTNDELKFNLELAYCDVRNVGAEWQPCDMGFGSRSRVSFDLSEVANYNQGGVIKRVAQHQICVKKIDKDQKIFEDGDGYKWSGKWPVYCAYVNIGNCGNYLINSKHALIGCVEVPLADGPGVMNPVKPFGIVAYVEPSITIEDSINAAGLRLKGLKNRGSKFDKPKIVLTHGLGASDFLDLTFDYTQSSYFNAATNTASENPSCQTFADNSIDATIYCAKPHPIEPDKICACVKGPECASNFFLGCAPRPTPEQSGYRIVADFREFQSPPPFIPQFKGPGVAPLFVELTTAGDLIYVNASNVLAYKGTDGKFYNVNPITRERTATEASGEFKDYKTMTMPNPIPVAGEFYTISSGTSSIYKRDIINIYGVDFAAMIPKIDSNGKPIYRRISSAYAEPANISECTNVSFCEGANCKSGSTNYALARDFFVPEGSRETSLCSSIVYPSKSCDTPKKTPPHDPEALKILCPGVLKELAGGMKICLENFSGWDLISESDNTCASIPVSCDEVTEPTAGSGFAIWPKMNSSTELEGSCDTGYGLTTFKKITLNKAVVSKPTTVSGADYDEYVQMYNTWSTLAQDQKNKANSAGVEVNQDYLKNYINKFLSTKTGMSQSYFDMFPSIVLEEVKPKRTCSATGQATVTNACVKKQGCPSITKPFADSGYGVIGSPVPFNGGDQMFIDLALNSNSSTSRSFWGTCQAPYKASGGIGPQMKCMIDKGTAPFSMTQTYESIYWIYSGNACTK